MLYGEMSLIYLTIIMLGIAAFFIVSLGLGGINMATAQLHNKVLGYVAALA